MNNLTDLIGTSMYRESQLRREVLLLAPYVGFRESVVTPFETSPFTFLIYFLSENVPEAGLATLFASERNGESFSYDFDVSDYPMGTRFAVTIWMAEIFFTEVGDRVFDITIEGIPAAVNLDLIENIGSDLTAEKYSFLVTVTDGEMNFLFEGVGGSLAKVSGIEVLYNSEDQS